MVAPPTPADRWIAALSHCGVPLYGLLLPLLVWAFSERHPFRRRHASQAFSFQCVFLAGWVVAVVLMMTGRVEPLVLLAVLAAAMVVELPQMARALVGRPPLPLVPVTLLPTVTRP